MKQAQKGFTIFELVYVMVILAAIVVMTVVTIHFVAKLW